MGSLNMAYPHEWNQLDEEVMIDAWSWTELAEHSLEEPDRINGPTSAQANLRLFGKNESEVIVTLYRDIHAWCPYCSKIWLWLEFKKSLTGSKRSR